MTSAELFTIMPWLILAGTAVVVMVEIAFYRDHLLTAALTTAGLVAAWIALVSGATAEPLQITPLLFVDGYARFFMGLMIAATLVVVLLSYSFFGGIVDQPEELYVLLLLATLGSTVLVASSHFASFFLGLEVLSVSLYALIAYPREQQNRIEAGLKYLILAGASAAFLLFGLALVYASTGAMDFATAMETRPLAGGYLPQIWLAGWGLIVVGIGFKLAVVPFHLWTPDVYHGAPPPVTAYVATVSKGAVFVLLLRLIGPATIQLETGLALLFSFIAIASMFAGNLLALFQNNVKRILAYSSIAHVGYLLVALLAAGALAKTAVAFYLCAYFITTLSAFGIVTVLSVNAREADALADYQGLFWRRPWLAGLFTATLLSLAGIPLTAGFVGKFYLVAAGVQSALWLLVIVLVINSAIGLFYYLRVVVVMFLQLPRSDEALVLASLPLAGSTALAVLALLLVWLGVYPAPVIEMILKAISGAI
jgi:NADH-quinone oxidoreductase subunit N